MRHLTTFILCLLLLAIVPTASTWAAGTFTLVLDAGHGGKDPGALGKTGKEKNINLAVALAVGQLVEQNMKDVKEVD
jgi:N-acetylmuramoyl-L-alanine amidase